MPRRPDNWLTLWRALENAVGANSAYDFLSDGIRACISNANSLREDFCVLALNSRQAGAQFLYATAMEEMGKALILFDMVRSEWRQEWQTRLCKAFYNHLKKYGYAKTIIFPGNGTLVAALQLYKVELVEWWANNDPEDFAPSMPADAIAEREWAIYVDWNEYDGRWFYPPDSSLAHYFIEQDSPDGDTRAVVRIKQLLDPLMRAETEGLFSPTSLEIVHNVFSLEYISFQSDQRVRDACGQIGARLRETGITLSQETLDSNFMMFPLYAAILAPQDIPGLADTVG